MERKLIILTDYNGNFYCNHKTKTMDVKRLKQLFKQYYKVVEVLKFNEIYNNLSNYKNYDIVYTSIENSPAYKEMIIQIIYILSKNNNVYPRFDILLSHDNKIYQEYVKDINDIECIPAIKINNFIEFVEKKIEFPCVIKNITGSGSRNVFIAKSKYDCFKLEKNVLIRNIKYNIMMRKNPLYNFKAHLLIILLKLLPSKQGYDLFTQKCRTLQLNDCCFLLQKYIPNQLCDYKVLVYYNKYFCIKRDVREGDFRASGSGRFESYTLPKYALDSLKKVYEKLDSPIISFDILIDESNKKINIIEWQGIHHGTATLEISNKYFEFDGNNFIEKDNTETNIEDLFVEAYIKYIREKNEKN